MKRFLILWIVLGAAQFVGRLAISSFVFRSLDLRFLPLFQNVLVPALQAALLCAALSEEEASSRWKAWNTALREPPVAFFLGLDAVVLLLAWTLRPNPWFLLTERSSIPTLLAGLETLASGGLLILLAARRSLSAGERAWLLAAGLGTVAYGLDYAVPWLFAVPGLLLPGQQQIVGWLLVYPFLFLLSVAFLLKTEGVLRRRWPLSALVLDAAPAFALAGGTMIALNFFFGPNLTEPWSSLVKTCSFLFAASLFAGLLFAVVSSRPEAPRAPAPPA